MLPLNTPNRFPCGSQPNEKCNSYRRLGRKLARFLLFAPRQGRRRTFPIVSLATSALGRCVQHICTYSYNKIYLRYIHSTGFAETTATHFSSFDEVVKEFLRLMKYPMKWTFINMKRNPFPKPNFHSDEVRLCDDVDLRTYLIDGPTV